MDKPLDERYRLLLEDTELWPRLLRDDQFWRQWELLPKGQRTDALDRRVYSAMSSDLPRPFQLLHAEHTELFLALVEMEGLARARELLLQEMKH
ncbi:MAG: hypothetical protein DMF91_22895 [Acidobacteria bacterium]|nr:MAG: hypothetical protein DMF91_22895 [Acidobacteriota bacterium]